MPSLSQLQYFDLLSLFNLTTLYKLLYLLNLFRHIILFPFNYEKIINIRIIINNEF